MATVPLKAVCPADATHTRFVTTAHVVQDWIVDAAGTFIDELATLETTHDPDPDNLWTCHTCGELAVVTRTT